MTTTTANNGCIRTLNLGHFNYISGHNQCKGNQFKEQSILDIKTHFKPTETFQYTSSHPPGVKKRIREGPSTETSIDS